MGAVTELSAGVVVAGKYRLERALASGGMGSVWVAHHLQLDIDVAIKFMDAALATSAELRGRFEREARAAARLKTRHVVQILDHGEDGELSYIAMELLDGEDLAARLRRQGRFSLHETSALLDQIARGLGQAHAAGIVHRDLKPANVFLTFVDGEEVAKLLDFGVAKLAAPHDGEATRSGVVVGSPNYMSPEQARSQSVDHRSDLWSLAVILFRCVTGQPPFKGDSTTDVLLKICADPIPVPSRVAPELPPSVDAFFARALERAVDRRFASAAELAEAFALAVGASRGAGPSRASMPDAAGLPVAAEMTPPPSELVKTERIEGAPVSGPAPFGGAALAHRNSLARVDHGGRVALAGPARLGEGVLATDLPTDGSLSTSVSGLSTRAVSRAALFGALAAGGMLAAAAVVWFALGGAKPSAATTPPSGEVGSASHDVLVAPRVAVASASAAPEASAAAALAIAASASSIPLAPQVARSSPGPARPAPPAGTGPRRPATASPPKPGPGVPEWGF